MSSSLCCSCAETSVRSMGVLSRSILRATVTSTDQLETFPSWWLCQNSCKILTRWLMGLLAGLLSQGHWQDPRLLAGTEVSIVALGTRPTWLLPHLSL